MLRSKYRRIRVLQHSSQPSLYSSVHSNTGLHCCVLFKFVEANAKNCVCGLVFTQVYFSNGGDADGAFSGKWKIGIDVFPLGKKYSKPVRSQISSSGYKTLDKDPVENYYLISVASWIKYSTADKNVLLLAKQVFNSHFWLRHSICGMNWSRGWIILLWADSVMLQ